MRISVEFIPHSETDLVRDAATVCSVMPQANAFNIPDLIRFPLRKWHACKFTREMMSDSIPHIRAIDIAPDGESPLVEAIQAAQLTEVLIIRGDPPRDMSHKTYPNSSEEITRRIKRRCPELRVYGGFDPYRHGFRDELAGVRRKVDAGADGFFTQPLFDLHLLEMWSELLRGYEIFWGIAPVVGGRSRAYREITNRVIFPRDFSPTLGWNRSFAGRAVEAIRKLDGNAYFMPVKVDLSAHLSELLPA